jgi:hypothetical protein
MDAIFKQLPTEIISQMLQTLTLLPEEQYWQEVYKNKFSTEVLSKVNPKGYFSQYVIPKLNHGWELVGIGKYIFCDTCLPEREIQENCCNCHMHLPCANCYSYGWYSCYGCSNEYQLVSWKQMQGFSIQKMENSIKIMKILTKKIKCEEFLCN